MTITTATAMRGPLPMDLLSAFPGMRSPAWGSGESIISGTNRPPRPPPPTHVPGTSSLLASRSSALASGHRRGRPGPMVRRPLGAGEVLGGVDERHVGERLREVPHQATGLGVELLREEPHVVPEGEEPPEDRLRVLESPLLNQVVGEPEGAGEEGALPRGKAIHVDRKSVV